jgi:hypothetical protein
MQPKNSKDNQKAHRPLKNNKTNAERKAPAQQIKSNNLSTSRGQAVRAQRRSQADAQRIANQYVSADSANVANRLTRANQIDDQPRLKIIGLGGMDGGGSKNMILVEYMTQLSWIAAMTLALICRVSIMVSLTLRI